MSERAVTVLVSVLIVILVAVVQERSRHLAAILATMPLTAPLAMWIVFSASSGDQRQTADSVRSMVIGAVASLVFVLTCWLGLRQEGGVPGHSGLCLDGLVPDRSNSTLDRILATLMESQESPSQHFRAMTELAVDLRTLPAQILERKGIAFPAAAFVSLARIPPAGRGDSAVE